VIGQVSLMKFYRFAVYNFTASVSEVINEVIPTVKPKISASPHRFSKSIACYIKKKTVFKKYKKYNFDYYS
jgi:hypothetical protein